MKALFNRQPYWLFAVLILPIVAVVLAACGGDEVVEKIVVQTVVVEKQVPGEKVVETVIVEKQVAGEKVVETVIVEKQVEKKVVETVIVEKVLVATPTPKVTVAGRAEVPRNRTMIMAGLGGEHPGAFTDVENFNPHSPGISRSGFYQAATEGLWYYNMLTGEVIPWLATDFEYASGFESVTVKIRPGIEWSDGVPFTANDVAFTLNMLLENDKLNRSGDVNLWTESAVAIDDQTVKVTFTQPAPRYVWDILTFRADVGVPMSPKHIFEGVDDPSTFNNYDPDKGWPIGTGPYELVSTTVERKIWDRRADWWAAKTGFHALPKVERLIFLPGMNEITMAQLLITNEIDMAFSLSVPNFLAVRGQNEKITSHHRGEPPYGYEDWWPSGLSFNVLRPPFDDPDVRWAMSYSIDRDQVVKFGFQGGQVPLPIPIPRYPTMQKYIDAAADLLEKYPTLEANPDKVAERMTKAGYARDKDDFWVKDGKRVEIEIVTFPQHPSTTAAAPVVTEQLRRNGFDATFSLPADFVERIFSGDATGFIWGHASMRDPVQFLDGYHCRLQRPIGEPAAYPNIYRWCNEEFSDLVDLMKSLPVDDPGVMPLYLQAMEIYFRELPDLTLTSIIITLPMNETFWTNWPSADNQYIHEGFWHRTALLLFLGLEPAQ